MVLGRSGNEPLSTSRVRRPSMFELTQTLKMRSFVDCLVKNSLTILVSYPIPNELILVDHFTLIAFESKQRKTLKAYCCFKSIKNLKELRWPG